MYVKQLKQQNREQLYDSKILGCPPSQDFWKSQWHSWAGLRSVGIFKIEKMSSKSWCFTRHPSDSRRFPFPSSQPQGGEFAQKPQNLKKNFHKPHPTTNFACKKHAFEFRLRIKSPSVFFADLPVSFLEKLFHTAMAAHHKSILQDLFVWGFTSIGC